MNQNKLLQKQTNIIAGVVASIFGIFIVLIIFGMVKGSENVNKSFKESTEKRAQEKASQPKPEPPKPKEDTSELNADVKFSSSAFQIINNEDKDWVGCKLKLNDKYEYKNATIPKKDSLIVSFNSFNKSDGTRFNYFETAPKNLYIGSCQNMSSARYGYYGIN